MPVATEPRRTKAPVGREEENSNDLQKEDLAFHQWYRFVLSYPPHLVRRYLERFDVRQGQTVLDPFCGTGTTLVECRKSGVASVGVEAHPHAALASRVKAGWNLSTTRLAAMAEQILRKTELELARLGLEKQSLLAEMIGEHAAPFAELSEDEQKLIPEGFLSPKPLLRLLAIRRQLRLATEDQPIEYREFFYLAFSHVIANGAGNFAFGPEIYRTKPKPDYDVTGHFAMHVHAMLADLEHAQALGESWAEARVITGDARIMDGVTPNSCHAVITSPPYPNEKDYTRISRVESVLLGLMTDRAQLRKVKQNLLRSNTRNVFVSDDDSAWVAGDEDIQLICSEIERRRIDQGKDSGFEKLYHKVVAHYFGGMARHFDALRSKLKRGARCGYVVGDQLSFLLVPIPTAQLLGNIAQKHGLRLESIDLWRFRLGTRSGTRVREEVLILRKP